MIQNQLRITKTFQIKATPIIAAVKIIKSISSVKVFLENYLLQSQIVPVNQYNLKVYLKVLTKVNCKENNLSMLIQD